MKELVGGIVYLLNHSKRLPMVKSKGRSNFEIKYSPILCD